MVMIVTSHTDDKIRTWSTNGDAENSNNHLVQVLAETHATPIQALEVNENNFYSASFDGTMVMWNGNGEAQQIVEGPHGVMGMCTISKQQVASVYLNHMLRVWNLETGECEQYMSCAVPCGLIIKYDAEHVLVGESAAMVNSSNMEEQGEIFCQVHLIHWSTNQIVHSFAAHSKSITALLLGHDDTIISAAADAQIFIWKYGKNNEQSVALVPHHLALVGHEDEITALAWQDSQQTLLLSASLDNTLRVWNMQTQACLQVIPTSAPVICMQTTSDAQFVITGHENGTICVWNTVDMKMAHTWQTKRQIVHLGILPA